MAFQKLLLSRFIVFLLILAKTRPTANSKKLCASRKGHATTAKRERLRPHTSGHETTKNIFIY
jgi:hypothetical protein